MGRAPTVGPRSTNATRSIHPPAGTWDHPPMTSTWAELLDRHRRRHRTVPEDAPGTVPAHRPRAAVLGCSDARVAPTPLFDAGPGELFTIRLAGHVATTEVLASLDFAVGVLGVDTVIVLGHTHCGAVTAALDDDADPALASLLSPIRHGLGPGITDVDTAVRRHVANTVRAIARHAGTAGRAVREERAELVGAVHDLATGGLEPLSEPLAF
ncbi:MAG: carbonic anhydrase [Actinomyces sp.]|nr:MAG: carbonic anhydrase [Actinomyces sp.]